MAFPAYGHDELTSLRRTAVRRNTMAANDVDAAHGRKYGYCFQNG